MRLSLSSLFYRSPFEELQKHADKIKECARLFREAAACHIGGECKKYDIITEDVAKLESEADDIKRNIRNHLPRGILMPVDKFEFFDYLREQDKVLDEVEDALFWLSFRPRGIPDEVAVDFQELVEAVIPPIERLPDLVALATDYFKSKSEAQRTKMKSLIRDIRQYERETDLLERELKFKIFSSIKDPLIVFHMIRLVEIVADIADHAQNASDRMRVMIAR
ncbi:MAG: TIGR00153 family protein [Desulfobacterales bacterium S3730MH5]|nr:MAG: TIGR00153 family protein [Desulfobacterales bacterium S3730MH5]OEU83271.1 MAG: TIGR00153 family protein [Desulfobacterales bacterium S5133MH4]